MCETKESEEIKKLKAEVVRLQAVIKDIEARENIVFPYSKLFNRTLISSILKSSDGGLHFVGKEITVGGWVKTARSAKADDGSKLLFIELNDGTCLANLQVLVEGELYDKKALQTTGTSLCCKGTLLKAPEGKEQVVELHVNEILYTGCTDGAAYPISKGKVKDPRKALEHLRSFTHLRPRTNVISAVARIRHALAMATHLFFHQAGFIYLHTPIITQSDCEGAGEMFRFTTLLQSCEPFPLADVKALVENVESLKLETAAQAGVVKQVKSSGPEEEVKEQVEKLLSLKKEQEVALARFCALGGIPRKDSGEVDTACDFFGKNAYATVSGQLHAENYACAMSNVYTFGPTFRAEKSDTKRHLAEFWMIEPEIAFADLSDNMNLAESYIQFCCQYLLDHQTDNLQFLSRFHGQDCIGRLKNIVASPFARCEYREAIRLLKDAADKQQVVFEYPVYWGADLATEHESYLASTVFQRPVIVYNYPAEIKSFYMRMNSDGTVAAMDVLVPDVGELVGGSQREERFEVLLRRMAECGLSESDYAPYIDLRRFGTVPHSGFGVGFERLVLFATRLENIRDVIPFPRWYKHLAD